jgi:NO-binding membrane sensor protein with MHYT domain
MLGELGPVLKTLTLRTAQGFCVVGISIWASLFVVVLSFAMEFALLRLDPRVRTARQL